MATSRPKPPSPPTYPQGEDAIHNHFYQIQADDQRPIAWYRRRRCFYISLGLAALLLIAVSAGIASVIIISKQKASHHHDDHEPSTPTPALTTGSSSSETSSSSSTTSPTGSPSTRIVSSIVTVTFTKSEESKAVETTVITLTATQTESSQDIGKMLSSMLSPFPMFTTEVVTVTADGSTTSVPSSSKTSTSSRSTSSSSIRTTSSSSSPIPSPSVPPPSLSNISNIAAVDVNVGPSNLHRRLIVWQDQDASIIARDSINGKSEVYRIDDKLAEDGIKAKLGTHLAAASDSSGAIHVFYVSSDGIGDEGETASVSHIVQRKAGKWESRGQPVEVTGDSSLSATWHRGGNGTQAILLGFQSPENAICMLLVGDGNADTESDGQIIDITQLLNLDTGGWSAIGLSIASGVPLGSTGNRNETGLYVLMEGQDEALVAECSINDSSKSGNAESECRWLEGVFANADGEPVEISSHPTKLAWTLVRPGNDSPPIIHGFLSLGSEGTTVDDHRLVEEGRDWRRTAAETTTSATEARSTMVSYKVEEADIEAMAMTDERTLLVRAGTRLFEFSFVNGAWQDRREIETILSVENDR
ncbi:unnamed protein product [Clonostachys rosea]|uniref:Fucose-specific lectin n=1 Tax=Bionectria ochroleuca TaxID=29856 RepID=A0ABY6TYP8_BIOOC|nr:unnamed protein product [Clonostachys rosea]